MKNVAGKYKIIIDIDPEYKKETKSLIDSLVSPLVSEYSNLKWLEGLNEGFSTVFDLSQKSSILKKVVFSFDCLNSCVGFSEAIYKDGIGKIDALSINILREATYNHYYSEIQKAFEELIDGQFNEICSKFRNLVNKISANNPKDLHLNSFYWDEVCKSVSRFNPQEWDSDIYEKS